MGVESSMERQKSVKFFQEKRNLIIEKWFDALLNNYSPEAAKIFKREKDPFANPLGYNIHLGVEGILDWFEKEEKQDDVAYVSAALDKILRILAVQELTPGQALSFIVTFKKIIKNLMRDYYKNKDAMWSEWQIFDERLDNLMLIAIEIYSNCREKLYQIKVDEANHRVYSLLRRANIVPDYAEHSMTTTDQVNDCGSCNSCETEEKDGEGCKDESNAQS